MKSDEELIRELREATDGLLMMSESDYPFEIIEWETSEELSLDELRGRVNLDADTRIEETSIDDFFHSATGEQEWKGAAQLETVKRFQALVRLLKENLTGVKVYRAGERNIGVYIIGRGREGNWLGLSTRVVET